MIMAVLMIFVSAFASMMYLPVFFCVFTGDIEIANFLAGTGVYFALLYGTYRCCKEED